MFCTDCGACCIDNANYCHVCGAQIAEYIASQCIGCGEVLAAGHHDDIHCGVCNKIVKYFHHGYPYLIYILVSNI